MNQRITLRDIAKAAGVHYTTVARALRNSPALPIATRQRIQAIADELGYTPDPMMSALSSYRLSRRKESYQGVIGWIDGYSSPPPISKAMFEGAKERAGEMGYNLESFRGDSSSGTRTEESLNRVLLARGVRNLIIAPHFSANSKLDLDWKLYSAVSVSLSVAWPPLNLITNDQFYNITLTMAQLRKLGYRRIGFILERRLVEITAKRWLGGYLASQQELAPKDRLEPLIFDNFPSPEVLRCWWKRWKPDALVTEEFLWRKKLSQVLNLRCPDEIGIAALSLRQDSAGNETMSGIQERHDLVGAFAIEHLVRMEHMDERGIPASPFMTLVQGEWVDARSTRLQ